MRRSTKKGALCIGCPGRFKIAAKGQPFRNSKRPPMGSGPRQIDGMPVVRARRSANRRTCLQLMSGFTTLITCLPHPSYTIRPPKSVARKLDKPHRARCPHPTIAWGHPHIVQVSTQKALAKMFLKDCAPWGQGTLLRCTTHGRWPKPCRQAASKLGEVHAVDVYVRHVVARPRAVIVGIGTLGRLARVGSGLRDFQRLHLSDCDVPSTPSRTSGTQPTECLSSPLP